MKTRVVQRPDRGNLWEDDRSIACLRRSGVSGPCCLNEDSDVIGGHLGREGQPRNSTWDRNSSVGMRSLTVIFAGQHKIPHAGRCSSVTSSRNETRSTRSGRWDFARVE